MNCRDPCSVIGCKLPMKIQNHASTNQGTTWISEESRHQHMELFQVEPQTLLEWWKNERGKKDVCLLKIL